MFSEHFFLEGGGGGVGGIGLLYIIDFYLSGFFNYKKIIGFWGVGFSGGLVGLDVHLFRSISYFHRAFLFYRPNR